MDKKLLFPIGSVVGLKDAARHPDWRDHKDCVAHITDRYPSRDYAYKLTWPDGTTSHSPESNLVLAEVSNE